MDARIDPSSAFGISLGDAHVFRNAGGNPKDAMRSLLISQHLLGTREILLIKHVRPPITDLIYLRNEKRGKEENGKAIRKTDDPVDGLRNDKLHQYRSFESRGR